MEEETERGDYDSHMVGRKECVTSADSRPYGVICIWRRIEGFTIEHLRKYEVREENGDDR